MKKKCFVVAFSLFCCVFSLKAQLQQYLVGGCGLDKVAVINRNGDILWEFDKDKNRCGICMLCFF